MVAATPIALGVTFGILAIIAVWARFWARRKKRMTWRLDDWMLVPSLILTLGNVVVMFIAATLGHMGELRPLDHRGFPPIDASFQTFYKCIYANKLLTTVAIALIRYAILLLYGRIFRGRAFTASLWVLYFLNGAWGIAFTFMFIFSCRPISDGWKSPVGAKGRRCLPVSTNQASAVSSVIIDFLMLLIPWAPILRLQMNKKEKAAVLGIFGLGFIVMVTAIGKTVEFYVVGGKLAKSHQIQYIMAPTMYWSIPETCIAVIGACLPTLRPLFHGWSPESVIGSVRSALSLKSLGSNHGKPANALTLQSHSGSRSGDSVRGLRDSQDHEIPAMPKSEPKIDENRANQIHVESQIVVQSSDARGQRSGLSDDP